MDTRRAGLLQQIEEMLLTEVESAAQGLEAELEVAESELRYGTST